MNSKMVWALVIILITGPTTWLIAGSTFNDKVDTIINQNQNQRYQDSLQNLYLVERNEKLVTALETSSQAIINLDSTVQRINQQMEFMQSGFTRLESEITYMRTRIDKIQK